MRGAAIWGWVVCGAIWLACGQSNPGGNEDAGAHVSDAGTADGGSSDAGVRELVLLTSLVADGVVGAAYSQPLAASGGGPPLTWFLWNVGDQLSWLSIESRTGMLAGTPTVATSQSFEVRVRDAAGREVSRTFLLSVRACRNGEAIACHLPVNDSCQSGTRTCANGELGECVLGGPSSDVTHCGAAGEACGSCSANANRCVDGLCQCGDSAPCSPEALSCCASAGTNGTCVDTQTNPDFCGGCGTACDSDRTNVLRTCSAGACTNPCEEGFARCPPSLDERSCSIDLRTHARHCGGCGNRCPDALPNATVPPDESLRCRDGRCQFICNTGYASCDTEVFNGCETPTDANLSHCGQCGRVCTAPAHGYPVCAGGQCGFQCNPGYNKCGDSCIWNEDFYNCGGCGKVCTRPHASTTACESGQCKVLQCEPGWADCDKNPDNGCETSLLGTDPGNCGACGTTRCTSCNNGTCVEDCGGGLVCSGEKYCSWCERKSCGSTDPADCLYQCCMTPGSEP